MVDNMYDYLLSEIKSRGSSILTFNNYLSKNSGIILRHDIDFSLKYAAEMAERERVHGIISTYFIMLSSSFYNPMYYDNQCYIDAIMSCGHEIGLHFDPSIYNDYKSGLEVEFSILQKIIKRKINTVSFHRPGTFLDNNIILGQNLQHTYEDVFTKSMSYVSDSAGNIERVIKHVATLDVQAKHQILIHPIWWRERDKNEFSIQNALNELTKDANILYKEECIKNCKSFKDLI